MFHHHWSGERGALKSIIPKARRGIHDQNSNMRNKIELKTKYQSERTQNVLDSQEAHDEVDNVLSKFQRASSPIMARKQLPRRSSVDAELSDSNSDSDSEDILSKSSPADFQIHSLYRNEHFQHKNCSRDGSYNHLQENLSRSSDKNITELQNKCSNGSCLKYIIPIIIVLGAVCFMIYPNYINRKVSFRIYDKINFYDDVRSMAQRYKVKPDSMLQVRTGIDTIFQNEDAGSFIFTYDGNTFDSVRFNSFMDNIASAASRYLRNDTRNVQHVVLDNNKLITIKTDADLIHEFRDNVAKTGVLLVQNIERVPAKLAMAFHYYCDEFNPLVKKSAIFFTLDVAKCKSPLLSKTSIDHDYIERCLKEKWKEINLDKIAPLLTRVVGIIVDVTNI